MCPTRPHLDTGIARLWPCYRVHTGLVLTWFWPWSLTRLALVQHDQSLQVVGPGKEEEALGVHYRPPFQQRAQVTLQRFESARDVDEPPGVRLGPVLCSCEGAIRPRGHARGERREESEKLTRLAHPELLTPSLCEGGPQGREAT